MKRERFVGTNEGQKAVQAQYFDESVDPEYETTRPHGAPRLHRWLLRKKFRLSVSGLEEDLPKMTALTVCGGSGMDAEFLARAGARVITSDISFGAALRARERARRYGLSITPIVADAEHLPFADRQIDLVYVHDGLHHLEVPAVGLQEMARVARRSVCVTEPTRAIVTKLAVILGLALDREEAGNRVARLIPSEVSRLLSDSGFGAVKSHRYMMYYGHEPGVTSKIFSVPVLYQVARAGWMVINLFVGRIGNKLTVHATRERREHED